MGGCSSKRMVFRQSVMDNISSTCNIIVEEFIAPSVYFSRLFIPSSLRHLNDRDKGLLDPMPTEIL
ncbi:hypothetical protein Tco_1276685, partial [Tanacetum coccineum]